MLDLKEIKNSSSIRLQNGHLVLLTHLRYISTDTASTETLGFLPIYVCVLSMYLICPFPDIDFLLLYMFIIVKLN